MTATPGRNRVEQTTDRILQAAAELFAEHGYNGVSIRMIVREAGVQISSLYHRYGSKADLLEAVFTWYVEPMRRERETLFAAYREAVAETGEHDLEALLATMLGPAMRLSRTADTRPLAARLAGFFGTDPSPDVRAVIARVYDDEMRAFMDLLRDAAPPMSDAAFFWAAGAIYGTLIYVQSDMDRVRDVLGMPMPGDHDEAVAAVTRFLAAGVDALKRS